MQKTNRHSRPQSLTLSSYYYTRPVVLDALFAAVNERLDRLAKLVIKFPRPQRKFLKFVPLALIILAVISVLFAVKTGLQKAFDKSAVTAESSKVDVGFAKASTQINKEFDFPIKDDKGKELTRLKYLLESAEIRDQIIVQSKVASAVKGRTFLILNIKVTNAFDQAVEINARDYVRLAISDDKSEWIAPDIHNDPVNIRPISTKSTRLGFPIDENSRNLYLQFGDINGKKEVIKLDLK